jgi:hypothetical protein
MSHVIVLEATVNGGRLKEYAVGVGCGGIGGGGGGFWLSKSVTRCPG